MLKKWLDLAQSRQRRDARPALLSYDDLVKVVSPVKIPLLAGSSLLIAISDHWILASAGITMIGLFHRRLLG